jgi:hypothetical protein
LHDSKENMQVAELQPATDAISPVHLALLAKCLKGCSEIELFSYTMRTQHSMRGWRRCRPEG